MKNSILLYFIILLFSQLLFAQNINYKVYDAGANDITSDQISYVFPVPQGNLFVVSTDKGAVFKLYDNNLKLLKTTPLIQDITKHRSLYISDIYKIDDKLMAVFWSGAFIKNSCPMRRSCIIFEYDLTGKFIKSTTLPDLKSTIEQDLFFSSDSTKLLYWASTNTFKSGYLTQLKNEKENERYLSFKIYDNKLKELASKDVLLDFIKLEKGQYVYIHNAIISNSGMVYFYYTIISKSNLKRELSCFIYDSKTNMIKNKLVLNKFDNSIQFYSVLGSKIINQCFDVIQYDDNKLCLIQSAYYDKEKRNVDYKNKYDIINFSEYDIQVESGIKMPLLLNNYETNEYRTVSDEITSYSGFVNFNDVKKSYYGKFIVQRGSSSYYNSVGSIYTLYISNNNETKFIKNIATAYGETKHEIYFHRNFINNGSLNTIYYQLKNDVESKSNKYLNFNIIPCITITGEDGNMKTIEFIKDINIDYQDLTYFHKIGEGKYISQFKRLNKYIIITVE